MNFAERPVEELISIRNHLFTLVPERAWFTKNLESNLLIELYKRSGVLDQVLFSRTFFSVPDISVFDGLRTFRAASPDSFETQQYFDAGPVLFIGSKFGEYVSSQEYVWDVLKSLNDKCEIVLASDKPISNKYQDEFDVHGFAGFKDLYNLIESRRITKLVDLTGSYSDEARKLSRYVSIFSPWGSFDFDYNVDASIAWPELVRYHKFIPCSKAPSLKHPMMFLPSESPLRRYPSLRVSRGNSKVLSFGAFCRTAKLSLSVIDLWISLLLRYPNASLTFSYIQSNCHSEKFVKAYFESKGIRSARVNFLPRMNSATYLDALNDIDICLGAMPEQGGISCMDSLLMGCPYVVCNSLSNTFTATGCLQYLGLSDWAADDEASFSRIIQTLISNIDYFRSLETRRWLRELLLDSTLANSNAVAEIWRDFLHLN